MTTANISVWQQVQLDNVQHATSNISKNELNSQQIFSKKFREFTNAAHNNPPITFKSLENLRIENSLQAPAEMTIREISKQLQKGLSTKIWNRTEKMVLVWALYHYLSTYQRRFLYFNQHLSDSNWLSLQDIDELAQILNLNRHFMCDKLLTIFDSPLKYNEKKQWTEQEDQLLKATYAKYDGVLNHKQATPWGTIVIDMNIQLRTQNFLKKKQVFEHWSSKLNPQKKSDHFTRQEDDLILRYSREFGQKWSKIAKLIGGRTQHQIKNRFRSLVGYKRRRRDIISRCEHLTLNKLDTTVSGSITEDSLSSDLPQKFNNQVKLVSVTKKIKKISISKTQKSQKLSHSSSELTHKRSEYHSQSSSEVYCMADSSEQQAIILEKHTVAKEEKNIQKADSTPQEQVQAIQNNSNCVQSSQQVQNSLDSRPIQNNDLQNTLPLQPSAVIPTYMQLYESAQAAQNVSSQTALDAVLNAGEYWAQDYDVTGALANYLSDIQSKQQGCGNLLQNIQFPFFQQGQQSLMQRGWDAHPTVAESGSDLELFNDVEKVINFFD